MPARNSTTSYGSVSKIFHWGMALLVIGLLAVGLTMGDITTLQLKMQAYNLHKALGITVLLLVTARIGWHFYSPRPALVSGLKRWEAFAARSVHAALYIAMVGMPLSGWLMSSAKGRSVSYFGLFTLPDMVQKSEALGAFFATTHTVMAYTLIACVALHAAAALKHHFIGKDDTLRRMLPF